MARRTDLAAYYRAHRVAFDRALSTGRTPAEAAADIAHEEAVARCRQVEARLRAKMDAPLRGKVVYEPADARWMMRD